MAAALANRTQGIKAFGLLRPCSTIFRTLTASTSPAPSSGEAEESVKPKPKPRKKKNLFEVAQFLPNWGIGYKMAKSHWRDVSYEITRINLYKDGRHGKAWGIRYKAGVQAADAPAKISGVHKRGWKYFPESRKKLENTMKLDKPATA